MATSAALIRGTSKDHHEIVIIDSERDRLDDLAMSLDASFLCRDATSPNILNEASPKRTDVLYCLTDQDQTNIITALLGRHIGYKRAIPSIMDPKLGSLCRELDFEHFVTPAETVAEKLQELAKEDESKH